MGAFTFENAYPTPDHCSLVESDDEQADFKIDSDASNADLLELKQELNKLGPEKAQRDLADATIAATAATLSKLLPWTLMPLHPSKQLSPQKP